MRQEIAQDYLATENETLRQEELQLGGYTRTIRWQLFCDKRIIVLQYNRQSTEGTL